ncbi:MAG TPA: PilZ domain-containing protein [Candidatus Micrarchaeaceae archaeon]|nr:PilZ domain-containing protein [Candidatus Micrarchaeaceae archaeon]
MGALPERKEPQAALSPLRESQFSQTVSVSTGLKPGPRRFTRVPTHTVGVVRERRSNPRAKLSLPLRLTRIGDAVEPYPVVLVTRNISSGGVYFLAPREIAPGTAIELEVALVDRPTGMGNVQLLTAAHVIRAEEVDVPGWRGYAASFDDISIQRDDKLPARYHAR